MFVSMYKVTQVYTKVQKKLKTGKENEIHEFEVRKQELLTGFEHGQP